MRARMDAAKANSFDGEANGEGGGLALSSHKHCSSLLDICTLPAQARNEGSHAWSPGARVMRLLRCHESRSTSRLPSRAASGYGMRGRSGSRIGPMPLPMNRSTIRERGAGAADRLRQMCGDHDAAASESRGVGGGDGEGKVSGWAESARAMYGTHRAGRRTQETGQLGRPVRGREQGADMLMMDPYAEVEAGASGLLARFRA